MRLGMYGGDGEIPVKEMVETLMRDKIKADESKLPNIWSLDLEINLSSIFVEFDTPLVKLYIYITKHEFFFPSNDEFRVYNGV